uniref:Uncharacterized protein n=1 Tax=Mycena chlorophos TaxID=658473 RepID=A0ABQ0L8Y8_MYCCL|nr:predicted protein [Mycena chlorophos]
MATLQENQINIAELQLIDMMGNGPQSPPTIWVLNLPAHAQARVANKIFRPIVANGDTITLYTISPHPKVGTYIATFVHMPPTMTRQDLVQCIKANLLMDNFAETVIMEDHSRVMCMDGEVPTYGEVLDTLFAHAYVLPFVFTPQTRTVREDLIGFRLYVPSPSLDDEEQMESFRIIIHAIRLWVDGHEVRAVARNVINCGICLGRDHQHDQCPIIAGKM